MKTMACHSSEIQRSDTLSVILLNSHKIQKLFFVFNISDFWEWKWSPKLLAGEMGQRRFPVAFRKTEWNTYPASERSQSKIFHQTELFE